MFQFQFGRLSEERLARVHPDLVQVMRLALVRSPLDFGIGSSTIRTYEQQVRLVREGRSRTLNSRHIPGWPMSMPHARAYYSHAVDVLLYTRPGELSWERSDFETLSRVVLDAAAELRIPVEWGGHFKGFFDGPHFQLPWDVYPVRSSAAVV